MSTQSGHFCGDAGYETRSSSVRNDYSFTGLESFSKLTK